MATTEVETIGVKLTLDAGGFVGSAQEATAAMNKFQQAAMKAGSGASQMKAGAGGAGTGSSSAQMAAVNVPVTVNAESLAVLRAQIVKGLGAIPVTITPQFATQGKYSIQNVMGSMLSTQYGMTQTKGVQVAKQVMEQALGPMPKKAYGGAVQQGRPVLVGERRPEVFTPRSSGTIHPDAERFYREKTRERRHEVELAALEYQQQRQHEQRLRSFSPGHAIRRIRDEALLRLDMGIDRYDQQAPQRLPHRARGGNVSPANAARRQRAFDITRRYGNIRGWEAEMWRQQEASERADAAAALRAEAERERWSPLFPSSNVLAWKHPEKGELTPDWRTQVKGSPLSIWGDEHRAHGGPAHKGGLPKGYHIEFYSPEDAAMRVLSVPSLEVPYPGLYKNVKKPIIKGPREAAGIVTVVKKGPKVVATFPFSFSAERSQWGVSTPYGSFHPDYSLTDIEHRRKGLATAAYMKTERFTGRPIAPSPVQLVRGKAFWGQPNRPFGKIFGPRPADQWVLESAQRDEANDRARREAERVYEARTAKRASPEYMAAHAIPEPPGWVRTMPTPNFTCSVCGTVAGPYTSRTNLEAHMRAQHPSHAFTPAPPSIPALRNEPPVFGQPLPPRQRQRNSPQEQMRRAEGYYYGEAYRVVDPWSLPARTPQRRPVFGEGFSREGGSRLTFAPSHDPMRRMAGGLVHAGFGALAYRATMENEGGTFPLSGGPQPPKGYAVGIQTGTAQLVPANDPRAFLRAYGEQRRSQIAAGNFPPYVGTWLHEGQIHIDPAAVLGRKREADMVARAKAQLAFFDLKRFEEIPTSSHKFRANAERINQLIMLGRKRMAGGPAFGLSGKPAELIHHLGYRISTPNIEIPPEVSLDIDRIRSMPREHFLAVEPPAAFTAGKSIVIGEAFGNRTGVTLNMATPRPNIPPESARRWRTRYYRHEMQDFGGLLGIHNHPLYKGSRNIWRPSIPDIRGMFAGNERESWVVTPESTMVMRNPGYRRDPGQAAIGRSMAEALSQKLGVDIGQYIGRSNVIGGFTPKFIKEFESAQTLTSLELQKAMLDRVATEYGFDWELWKHPNEPYTKFPEKTTPSFGVPLLGATSRVRPRRSPPPSDQPGFGFARGGRIRRMAGGPVGVHQVSVRDLYKLQTPKMQKMEEWESPDYMAHLRDSMRTEGIKEPIQIRVFQGKVVRGELTDEDKLHAIVYDGNHRIAAARQMPDDFKTLPVQIRRSDSPEFLTPEHIGLKRRCGGGPVHAKQGIVALRMTPEELDFIGNLRTTAAQISPEQVKFGKVWYSDAQKWIHQQATRYGIDPITARGVTAALSAGTEWGVNKSKAHRIFSTHGLGLFGESFPYPMNFDAHLKAKAIMDGADPEKILGHTPKVGQFYRNLGGDLNALTLDRWAFRTATRGHLSKHPGDLRGDIDVAYRKVAAELGMHPVELQAAAWLYEKQTNPSRMGRKSKPQSIGQLEAMFSPMRRATGGPALASDPSHGLVHPGGGFGSSIVQTAADWARDPFMAIMAWQSQQQSHKARGGDTGKGLYIVGEVGKELFVPNRLVGAIPKKVMDQIPKAASGMQVIGQKPNSLFAPPEDGIIIPNRLMDQIPHAATGRKDFTADIKAAMQRADVASMGGTEKYFAAVSRGSDPITAPATAAAAALEKVAASGTQAAAAQAKFTAGREPEKAYGAGPTGGPRQKMDAREFFARGGAFEGRGANVSPNSFDQAASDAIMADLRAGGAEAGGAGGVTRLDNDQKQRLLEDLGVQAPEPGYGHMLPARTPRGGFAAVASFLGVGQGQAKREEEYRKARKALDDEVKVSGPDFIAYQSKMDGLRQGLKKGKITTEEFTQEQASLSKQYESSIAPLTTKTKAFNEAAKAVVPSSGNVIKNLGVIIGATSLYGIAMTAASKGMEVGAQVTGKWVDEITGFRSSATATTSALGDATHQSYGNVQATLAQAGATAGLSKGMLDFVSASLGASISAKAGAKAQQETSDLYRAAMGQKGQAPQGLFGGYGGLLGTALFAEQMGGGKGFQEIVAGDVQAASRSASSTNSNIDDALKYLTSTSFYNFINSQNKGQSFIPRAPIISDLMDFISPPTPAFTAPTPEGMKNLTQYLDDLNAAGTRAQNNLGKTTKVTYEYTKSLDEVTKASYIAYQANDLSGLDLAQKSHVVVKINGEIAKSVKEYTDAIAQVDFGKSIVEPLVWAQTNLRQITAQLQMSALQTQRAQQLTIPWSVTTQLLQQPLTPPGGGAFPGAVPGGIPSGAAAGMSPAAAKIAEGMLADARKAQEQLTAIAAQGYKAQLGNMMEQFPSIQPAGSSGSITAIDAAQVTSFQELHAAAQAASTSIANTTIALNALQVQADKVSWANSVRLANRGLADALGTAGKGPAKGADGKTVAASSLGVMERTSHFLDVASTKLSLALQQRQITTQLAIAQFQAPGQTGEERYFAQKEAIIKAGIAQTQLGISQEQFALSQKIWIENANRAAIDAAAAINVMVSSRNAEKATIAAQASIAEQSKLLAADVAQMQTGVDQANTNWATITGAALSGISQFTGSLDDGVKAIYTALGYTSKTNPVTGATTLTAPATGFGSGGTPTVVVPGANRDVNGNWIGPAITTTPPTRNPVIGSGKRARLGGAATGFLGTTTGMSNMTVGEAGTEMIAVLRNPRAVSAGGGATEAVSVKLTDTSISSWMQAIQAKFPKVGLTDTTISAWTKALWATPSALDLSDKTITALGGVIATPAAAGGAKGNSQFSSYSSSMPKSERLDRFATALSKKTGLSYEASRKWAQAEVGPLNNLGIMTTNAQGKRVPMGYATPELGATAAAGLINSSSNYAGIRSSTGGSTLQQLVAIANSPWHEGFKPGIDPYYKRIFGLKAQGDLGTTMGATPMIVGEAGSEAVAILRNPRAASMAGMGSGGPMNLTININNASVRNDQDISSLARQVAIEVERNLARKGQMFGLRGPAV